MKKRWIAIPVAIGLLALVVTGGAIFAHGNGVGPDGKGNQVATRVAEILGLEQSVVQSAFDQAISERRDAALEKMLGRLVADERITQEEADAVLLWYQARPEAASHLRRTMFRSEESVQRMLDRLVNEERITQDEADQVLVWHQTKPDVLPGRGGFHHFRDPSEDFRGHFRGRSWGHFGGQMFRHGMHQRDGGETGTRIYRQRFRSVTPQLSTEGVLQ